MGRGGANALWSPGIRYVVCGALQPRSWVPVGGHPRACSGGHEGVGAALRRRCFPGGEGCAHRRSIQSYRVKPHGQLVLVSSRRCRPCTPSLSTSWSRTTLQGGWTPGRSHLQASFPLRCFQRLSLPHLATRQCDWRHNRYTRDASPPVLSYSEQPPSTLQRPRQIGTKLSHDVLNPAHVPL